VKCKQLAKILSKTSSRTDEGVTGPQLDQWATGSNDSPTRVNLTAHAFVNKQTYVSEWLCFLLGYLHIVCYLHWTAV
jgi:hypothetical protein